MTSNLKELIIHEAINIAATGTFIESRVVMDKASGQASPLKAAYSKSALQILTAYHTWHDRDAITHGVPKHLSESTLLGKGTDEIWKLALEQSGDTHLGLHAGAALVQYTSGHLLATLMANSKSPGEALRNFCNYHEVSSDAPHPRLESQGNKVVITITELDDAIDKEVMRHTSECLFSAIVTILSAVCKQPIRPTRVCFAWPSPGRTDIYATVFKAPVYFGTRSTALEFSNDTLDTSIPYADERLLATLTRYADSQLDAIHEPDTWTNKVKTIVTHSSLSIDLDISTVSDNLGIGPRTLQQKLKSEGTRYQSIIRDIKISIAKEYLSNRTIPLSEIALLLGYSEQSAFNHAFKQWTGLTPRQFRNK